MLNVCLFFFYSFCLRAVKWAFSFRMMRPNRQKCGTNWTLKYAWTSNMEKKKNSDVCALLYFISSSLLGISWKIAHSNVPLTVITKFELEIVSSTVITVRRMRKPRTLLKFKDFNFFNFIWHQVAWIIDFQSSLLSSSSDCIHFKCYSNLVILIYSFICRIHTLTITHTRAYCFQ